MKGDDPMKEISGTVFNIERFHLHDGAGIRTMVFLKGCLLDCPWCCNPESKSRRRQLGASYKLCVSCSRCVQACPQKALSMTGGKPVVDPQRCILCGQCAEVCLQNVWEIYGKEMTVREVWEAVRGDAAFFRRSGGGVTFSGGEPTMQAEFLLELLERTASMHRAIETSGYCSGNVFDAMLARIDYVMMDLKLADAALHRQYTGVSNEPILENLDRLKKSGRPFRIRIPVIPGVNDSEDNFEQTARLLTDAPALEQVELLPYHVTAGAKYEMVGLRYQPTFDTGCTPQLRTEIFRRHGLRCTHL